MRIVATVIGLAVALGFPAAAPRAEEVRSEAGGRLLAQGPVRQGPGSRVPPAGTPGALQAPTTGPTLPAGPPTLPLAGPLTLDPGKHAPKLHEIPNYAEVTALHGEINKLAQQFNGLAGSCEYMLGTVINVAKGCTTKNYTVADQKAAGCQGSETLDQCKGKLYRWCLESSQYQKSFVPKCQAVLPVPAELSALLKKYETHVKNGLDALAK